MLRPTVARLVDPGSMQPAGSAHRRGVARRRLSGACRHLSNIAILRNQSVWPNKVVTDSPAMPTSAPGRRVAGLRPGLAGRGPARRLAVMPRSCGFAEFAAAAGTWRFSTRKRQRMKALPRCPGLPSPVGGGRTHAPTTEPLAPSHCRQRHRARRKKSYESSGFILTRASPTRRVQLQIP